MAYTYDRKAVGKHANSEPLALDVEGGSHDQPTDEELEYLTGHKVRHASEPASWTKLKNGDWGVRSTSELNLHSPCTVVRKDGTKSVVNLDRLVWTGNEVWIYSVKAKGSSSSSGGSSYSRGRSYVCDECGDRVTPGSRCWETGMSH